MEIIVLLAALFATFMGAICGNGGGVIIKPVMDALLDITVSTISFMSSTTVLVMTITSLLRSRKGSVRIDKAKGTSLAIGGAAGGVLGSYLFSMVGKAVGNGELVSFIQNLSLIIFTAAVFIFTIYKSRIRTLNVSNQILTFIIGLSLGLISAFLGIGGGPINIIVLAYFFSMDSKTAALNSLFIILFAQITNLVSFMISNGIPELNYLFLIGMWITAVVGATLGRMVSKKVDNRTVDKLFMLLMSIIIAICLYNCIKFL